MPSTFRIDNPHQLTEYVRALRKSRGETQTDVAKKLGVSTMRVATMEKDLGRVSVHRVITLLSLLGAHLELEVESPPPPARGEKTEAHEAAPDATPDALTNKRSTRVGEW